MRILSRSTLRDFWEEYPDSQQQLKSWFAEAEEANWKNPNQVTDRYKSATILKGGRAVFNICGNKYRLVVWVNYEFQRIYIRFVGTHKEYDKINAEEI
ncbi:MAG: type II toxin-antitoxin system HigB family toxin [Bacteroidota bacterium]